MKRSVWMMLVRGTLGCGLLAGLAACGEQAPKGSEAGEDDGGVDDSDDDDSEGSGEEAGTEGPAEDDVDDSGADTSVADEGGEDPVHLEVDCPEPKLGEPVLRLLTREEFTNTVNDIFPAIAGQWQNALPANSVSHTGFDNSAGTVMGNQNAQKLLETAESVADAVTGTALANLLPCSTAAADAACATEFIASYGRRLFRRPLTAAEQERYLAFFDSALAQSDFATAIKWITVGLLQSPFAVYRSEIGIDMGNGTRQLTPHEIATELAYLYTSSTPSEALLAAADAGNLGDLRVLVDEMLATERGRAALQRFFEGYLSYTSVASVGRPAISEFTNVNRDMVAETRAFIDAVVFEQGGGLRELLTTPTTHPSTALAAYYGLPAPATDYAAVERPDGYGVGVFSQGSFLAAHASSDASSPTRRGLFAYTKLMCMPEPPLPNDVPQLSSPQPGVYTTRQRYEMLHGQLGSTCAACHSLFDPIGFAFEHFDEGGRYRATEAGLPIDATGTIRALQGGELSFDGVEELMIGLAENRVVYQCFSAYLGTFAFGTTTSCLAPSHAAELEAGTIGIAEAFAALSQEPHFTTRAVR